MRAAEHNPQLLTTSIAYRSAKNASGVASIRTTEKSDRPRNHVACSTTIREVDLGWVVLCNPPQAWWVPHKTGRSERAKANGPKRMGQCEWASAPQLTPHQA